MSMHLTLMGNASRGLPRNGLVALYDPYRDTYGRNVLAVGAEDFATAHGWVARNGATITVTPGQADPDGGNNAYRIQSSGGSSTVKYSLTVTGNPNPHTVYIGVYMKVLSGAGYVSMSGAGKVAGASEWSRLLTSYTTASENDAIYFETAAAGDSLDILVYHPTRHMSAYYPYSAPAGAPGTLQTGTDYSGNGNHLTLGATTGVSTDDPAYTGTAWSFDGGDYLARTAIPASTMPWPSLTIVFKTPASWTTEALFSTQGANGDGFGLRGCGNGKLLLNVKVLSGSYYFVMNTVSANTWHSIVFSHGAAPVIALDGVANASPTIAEGSPLVVMSAHSSLEIGKGQVGMGSVTYYTSEIGLVALHGRTLSWPEIARSYRYLKSLMALRGVTVA